MAGHNKWSKVKRLKAVTDSRRGKVFSRLARDITLAAKSGGGNPDGNARLRTLILKAREANMPADNVDRAVKKGTGELPGVVYEEVTYEGYGPGGVAVMVDCMTDNRTRTVGEVRHAFTKHGGNLGTDGSVAFLFKHCGQFIFAPGASEDKIMEAAIEAGAEDVLLKCEMVAGEGCDLNLWGVAEANDEASPPAPAAVGLRAAPTRFRSPSRWASLA